MGPFLFFLYINDIADKLVKNIRLFAGDTSLFIVVDNDPNVAAVSLTSDLDKIDQWASTFGVDFNPSKTCNINISRGLFKHPSVHFGFNGKVINELSTHYHLGLLFQNDAKWTSHINKIHKKAGSRLNRLRMFKHILDRNKLIKIYSAFI